MEETIFTIQTDHEALREILTTVYATGELAGWRLRLSEFEFYIVNRTDTKQEGADTMSRSKTKCEDKAALDEKVPVFTVLEAFFACAPKTKITDFELI